MKRFGWILGGLVLAFSRGRALELYVAPEGDDAWSGLQAQANASRTDGPLASLQGARDALRRRNHRDETVRIIVADGTYRLSETWTLAPEDGGTEHHPIIYEAAAGAHPVFSGGMPIVGWQEEGPGLWSALLPAELAGKEPFEQLWVNDRRAVRARSPNRGFSRVAGVAEEPATPASGAVSGVPAGWTRQAIRLDASDVALLARIDPVQRDNIQIVVYHAWETTRRFLTGYDPATGWLSFFAPPKHPFAGIKAGARYHLENARSFLDSPGEWFLEPGGRIYYRPRPDDDRATASIVAPRLEKFMSVVGTADHPVQHLLFRGLAFRHGHWLTPREGVLPYQAAITVGASVTVDHARDLAFEDCEISHLGPYALWFRNNCQEIGVRRCLLSDLGGGGVRIGMDRDPVGQGMPTGRISLENNLVTQGGRIFASSVGVWVGRSSDNRITHNEVSDFYYSGISVGWEWGYAPSTAKNNEISFNRIHHLGWGLMSDLGGIYTLGVSPGTVCRGNVIHDIAAADYGGWGLYLDEGSSAIVAEDNLVYRTTHGGFHLHYGENNVVRNNIFAFGRDAQLQLTRADGHDALLFTHNIVAWTQGALFAKAWEQGQVSADWNLYFRGKLSAGSAKQRQAPDKTSLSRERHSVMADPRFHAAAEGDFSLAADSPAWALGFRPFDYRQAGISGPAAWLRAAARWRRVVAPDWLEDDPFSGR